MAHVSTRSSCLAASLFRLFDWGYQSKASHILTVHMQYAMSSSLLPIKYDFFSRANNSISKAYPTPHRAPPTFVSLCLYMFYGSIGLI